MPLPLLIGDAVATSPMRRRGTLEIEALLSPFDALNV
jgi:hypothetical protein